MMKNKQGEFFDVLYSLIENMTRNDLALYPRQTGRRPSASPYGDQKIYKVAGKREHNARKSKKILLPWS